MKGIMNWLKEEESGQGLVEYALNVGLIALVCVIAVGTAGEGLEGFWDRLSGEMNALSD